MKRQRHRRRYTPSAVQPPERHTMKAIVKRRQNVARTLAADVRGATLIEFAIVAPIFIALLLATIETSIVLFTQQMLQTSVEGAGRLIGVGKAQKANMSIAAYRTAVCSNLPGYINCGNIVIDVRNASTLASLQSGTPAPIVSNGKITNPSTYNPGGPGSYNMIRLMYVWNVVGLTGTFDLSDSGPNKKLLLATSVVKVEPYNP